MLIPVLYTVYTDSVAACFGLDYVDIWSSCEIDGGGGGGGGGAACYCHFCLSSSVFFQRRKLTWW